MAVKMEGTSRDVWKCLWGTEMEAGQRGEGILWRCCLTLIPFANVLQIDVFQIGFTFDGFLQVLYKFRIGSWESTSGSEFLGDEIRLVECFFQLIQPRHHFP